MSPIGIIAGTSLFQINFLGGTKEEGGVKKLKVETKYGIVDVQVQLPFRLATTTEHNIEAEVVFIPRHGKKSNIPPHKVNHHANMMAFKELGVEKVISVTSVGSLKQDIKPKSLIVPHDYIGMWNIPTFYDDKIVHVTPSLDKELRKSIVEVAKSMRIDIIPTGIYFQTTGPRLETKAEIKMMKDYADVVGMNMASEATLAAELGLRYANISTVDNYAHGVTEAELSYKKIVAEASPDKGREDLIRLLMNVIQVL
jgi:5'-methylthioadenosine phosphorylase